MPDILSLTAPIEPPVNLPGGNQRPAPNPPKAFSLLRTPEQELAHRRFRQACATEAARLLLPLDDVDRHTMDWRDEHNYSVFAPGYADGVALSERIAAERNAAAVTA
jgi:hypothetical protein